MYIVFSVYIKKVYSGTRKVTVATWYTILCSPTPNAFLMCQHDGVQPLFLMNHVCCPRRHSHDRYTIAHPFVCNIKAIVCI